MCYEKIGPEMQRLGCKCPPPGYCFTIEHNKDYTPTEIDINVYVRYRTANGEEAEAILSNPRSDLEEGQRVRIKYHPKMKGNARLV
jgi:hypothetical protein